MSWKGQQHITTQQYGTQLLIPPFSALEPFLNAMFWGVYFGIYVLSVEMTILYGIFVVLEMNIALV